MVAGGVRSLLGGSTEYFALFGGVTASYLALKICMCILRIFKTHFLSQFSPIGTFLRSKGQWAVVTGATDGIGKEYARQLANFGINIVLISRTESKLQAVASEIESEFKVKTQIIAADYSQGTSIYDNIRARLSGLDIGVLVNNVGLSYDYPEFFLDVPDREKLFVDLINVNCTSVTMMSSIVMPSMVQKKKGVVINLASAAGNTPTPLLTVYSACKVYVRYLSECLNYEYADKGITVQCVAPFFVCSNMSKAKKPTFFIPSAKSYVRSALSTVGQEEITTGYFSHLLMKLGIDAIPSSIGRKMSFNTLKNASTLRKKKMAREKNQ